MRRFAAALLAAALALAAGAQSDPREMVREGVALLERGQVDRAEELFRRASALAPQDALPASWQGRALLAMRRMPQAAEALQRALDLDDAKPALVRSLRRETLDALGLAWGLQKEYAKSREVYARAVAYDADYPVFRYNLACVCALEGDRAAALAALAEYLDRAKAAASKAAVASIDPSQDEDFKGLWGDPAFESLLRERLRPQPDDSPVSAKVRAAGGALARGRTAEALEVFRYAVEAAPEDPRAWYLLGGALEATGDAPGAAKAFEKALDLSVPPKNLLTPAMVRWCALAAGRGRLAAGDAAGAVALLTRARDQDPFRPWPFYELARAHAALGEGAVALDYVRRTRSLSGALTAVEPRLPDPALDGAFKAFAADPAWAEVFGEPAAAAEAAPAEGETP